MLALALFTPLVGIEPRTSLKIGAPIPFITVPLRRVIQLFPVGMGALKLVQPPRIELGYHALQACAEMTTLAQVALNWQRATELNRNRVSNRFV